MRCLQHVLWRGALALGLLVSGGTGAMLVPQPAAPACEAGPRHVDLNHATALSPPPRPSATNLAERPSKASPRGTC